MTTAAGTLGAPSQQKVLKPARRVPLRRRPSGSPRLQPGTALTGLAVVAAVAAALPQAEGQDTTAAWRATVAHPAAATCDSESSCESPTSLSGNASMLVARLEPGETVQIWCANDAGYRLSVDGWAGVWQSPAEAFTVVTTPDGAPVGQSRIEAC